MLERVQLLNSLLIPCWPSHTMFTREDDKECHKILQSQDSYHAKVKALKYLEFTQDTIGHQKVTEKLSTPRIEY